MRLKFISRCILLVGLASAVVAQPPVPPGYTTVLPAQGLTQDAVTRAIVSGGSLPMWNYGVTAAPGLGGGSYTGTLMGRNPNLRAKSVTNIPLYIIPLKITITDAAHGAVLYDPTVADACFSGSPTDVNLVTQSPMFQTNLYDGVHAPTMNGVDISQGVPLQYEDAFVRANWWSIVGGTNFHLNFTVTVLPAQSLSFSSSVGQNYVGGDEYTGCGHIGVVDINAYDAAIQNLLKVTLAGTVNPAVFPMLLTNSVVNGDPGHNLFANCCALGYHSAYTSGSNLQVYSPFSVSAPFGGDISTISHEIAEALFDPTTLNATPAWGNEGQVPGACQGNLEVGDPLSPGFSDSIGTGFTITQNGFAYHLQELAFFNWFFGGTSTGAGGKYSNNGAFSGFAKLCPPGGTN